MSSVFVLSNLLQKWVCYACPNFWKFLPECTVYKNYAIKFPTKISSFTVLPRAAQAVHLFSVVSIFSVWSMKAVFLTNILGKSSERKSDWHWPCSVTAIRLTFDKVFVAFCTALWHFRWIHGVVANCSRFMAPFENSLSWAGVVHVITAVKRCLILPIFSIERSLSSPRVRSIHAETTDTFNGDRQKMHIGARRLATRQTVNCEFTLVSSLNDNWATCLLWTALVLQVLKTVFVVDLRTLAPNLRTCMHRMFGRKNIDA